MSLANFRLRWFSNSEKSPKLQSCPRAYPRPKRLDRARSSQGALTVSPPSPRSVRAHTGGAPPRGGGGIAGSDRDGPQAVRRELHEGRVFIVAAELGESELKARICDGRWGSVEESMGVPRSSVRVSRVIRLPVAAGLECECAAVARLRPTSVELRRSPSSLLC